VSLHTRHWDADGVVFLLVHGLASNAQMWDGVAWELHAAGHCAVAVDQRGHGLSDKPDTGYDFDTLSGDLVAVLDAYGIAVAVAAGQSWGANVVAELASRYPERVGGVALVDGGMRNMADRLPDWDEAARLLAPPHLEGTPLAEIDAAIRGMHGDWPESGIAGALANFEVREDGTVAPRLTRERHMRILRELWEHRVTDVVERLPVPVLGIPAGAHDAHHDIHAQRPALVARLLLEAFT
jgi:pimeloyl-ACP methyl ester carboxylesterase